MVRHHELVMSTPKTRLKTPPATLLHSRLTTRARQAEQITPGIDVRAPAHVHQWLPTHTVSSTLLPVLWWSSCCFVPAYLVHDAMTLPLNQPVAFIVILICEPRWPGSANGSDVARFRE